MKGYPIRYVSNMTGLSAHVIRAWERRYGALSPGRTESNRRLYSDEDVERLTLLRRALDKGLSIGQVANLTSSQLEGLVREDAGVDEASPHSTSSPAGRERRDRALSAVERLDSAGLDGELARAAAELGQTAAIDQVIVPLLESIGEKWREGLLRVSQEHLASAAIRTFLGRQLSAYSAPDSAPRIVLTTPAGQLHELGSLVAAVTAAAEGWRVRYLGPNLPATEIAGAADRDTRAVGLSIVFPPDDPRTVEELKELRILLGPRMPILVGGRSARAYHETLRSIGALEFTSLLEFRGKLERLRAPGRD